MRPAALRAAVGSALLGLAVHPSFASLGHRRTHQHYNSNHTHHIYHGHGVDEDVELLRPRGRLVNRSGQCAFPEGESGLVTITPSSMNRGWAMSPDQECTAGSYCPFACESGMVMNQWKKGTTYQYPESMDGGLYCDEHGTINKPFPDEPYCVEGVGSVNAVNNCGHEVAFCQTVLPGNEAMLIPTSVSGSAVLSVPGPSYWDSTASHFYINPPGYSTEEACVWGTGSEPIGNWSPYVAGANQDSAGNTYVKIGYNPIYTGSFDGVKPSFGLKVECDGNCNGLPCSIDPSSEDFGVVFSAESATGAGGADFCVVTVPEGGTANIVVFSIEGSTEESSSSSPAKPATTSKAQAPKSSTSAHTSSAKKTTTSEEPRVMIAAQTTTTSSSSTSTKSSLSTTTPPISTTTTSSSTTTTSGSSSSSSSSSSTTTTSHHSSITSSSTSSPGGIFHESGITSITRAFAGSSAGSSAFTTPSAELADVTSAAQPAAAATSSKSDAASPDQGRAAFAGLAIAFAAAAMLY